MTSAAATRLPRRVLVTGMFDMANYGDLLFPLVARHHLSAHGIEIVPVAPSAPDPGIGDAIPPLGLDSLLDEAVAADGFLIGGGYIVHGHPLSFIEDYSAGDAADWAGAGLWLGASVAAALRDVPLAWNAPGVPHPIGRRLAAVVAQALRSADYVSVRDRGSAELLAAPADVPVHIVPDPIAGLPALWPREGLAEAFRTLVARKGADPSARFLAVHLRRRSVAGVPLADIAAAIDGFAARHRLTPLVVAVGRSHDDPTLARLLAPLMRSPHILLDDPLGLREITAALAWSNLYVGASLHGYVVSAAYGVPGVLVARPAYRKFGGFLEHAGRPQDLARDWVQAFALAGGRLRDGRNDGLPPGVAADLNTHWNRVAAALLDGERRRAERRVFARAAMCHAADPINAADIVRGFLARGDDQR